MTDTLEPQPRSFFRRVLALLIPVFALLALVLVGRRATTAAPIATTPVVAAIDASASEIVADAPVESAVDDASKSALEQLPDGAVIIDLNIASEDELRKLPGVGATRAKRILELRARLGRFKSVDDLARIKGFGKALLKRIRRLARAGP